MTWQQRTLALMVPLLVAPLTARAQNWTAAEQEVLQALEACVQAFADNDMAHAETCTHDDFTGWRYDMPAPRNKAFGDFEVNNPAVQTPLADFSIQPLAVKVYGNVAVIHYYGYYVSRDQDGARVLSRFRWTDVMLKEGDRWIWIADHGGDDSLLGSGG